MRNFCLALVSILLGFSALSLLTDFDIKILLHSISNIEPLNWKSLSTVIFCGALIGWERMLKKKVLGMRTSIFIILGTYVFTALSLHVAIQQNNLNVDPTRIIGQIVSGIGFLGAGVMFTKNNQVSGLTSAATIWLLAALGVCVAVGYLATSIILATFAVVLLMVISEIDEHLVRVSRKAFASKTVNKLTPKDSD